MSELIDRLRRQRNIMTRPSTTIPSRIPTRSPTIASRITTRPTISTVTRPTISTVTRPTVRISQRPGININGNILPAAAATSTRSGMSSTPGGLPALTAGFSSGLGTTLGGIGGDISTTFGGVVAQAKGFIPTAVKIIAVVVILKIVLWLVKGRRR